MRAWGGSASKSRVIANMDNMEYTRLSFPLWAPHLPSRKDSLGATEFLE
jgi:hypothetical protein